MNNNINTPQRRLVSHPGATFAILFGTFFFMLCILSLLSPLLTSHIEDTTTALRLLTIFQSIFLFILPALITAVLATRLPATLLAIDHKPRLIPSLTILLTILLAIPAMNYIIEWNANLHLPQQLQELENTIRQLEDTAQSSVTTLIGSHTIGSLIVSLLIIGVMAGLSEELFFRGALQRTLTTTSLNKHLAVIITAIIFSFMHLQFFGFIPRLLLGAFFGYILLWSNNLWYCIIAHAANNILAVIAMWLNDTSITTTINLDTIGQTTNNPTLQITLIIISITATTLAIITLKRQLQKTSQKK